MKTPDFDEEMKKLKETEFEDLPLLINDMNTKAAAMNYKCTLAGENDDKYYIPSRQDHINGIIEIKQIDDKEIDNIANKIKKYNDSSYKNKGTSDKRLERKFSENDTQGI